jgi:hypothetical protein
MHLGNKKLCGGVLISERAILTARHCVEKFSVITVYLGSVSYQNDGNLQSFDVKWGKYSHSLHGSVDVALLFLPRTVQMNANVQAISLFGENYSYDGLKGTVSGWGLTTSLGKVMYYFVESNAYLGFKFK